MKPGQFLPLSVLALLLGPGVFPSLCQTPPPNDLFTNRIVLTGTNILVTGSNVNATVEPGEPDHAEGHGLSSVWWTWTAPAEGMVTISTAGSSFDTLLGVYLGSSVSQLTKVADSDDEDYPIIPTSKVLFRAHPGWTYQIAVDGYEGDSGDIQLTVQLALLSVIPTAPAWSLLDVDGNLVRSTNFSGKVLLVEFWATWCAACQAEIPDFITLQQKYGPDGFVIIGMSLDTISPAKVKEFILTNGINYVVVMADTATKNAFGGISGIPTTFLIDPENRIMQQLAGTQSLQRFEGEICWLLYNHMRLFLEQAGSQLEFRWVTNAVNFALEYTTNLAAPIWTTIPGPSEISNGLHRVSFPSPPGNAFYRLRLQD